MDDLIKTFRAAEAFVEAHFPDDIKWSRWALEKDMDKMSASDFYIEYVFGIYCAGFRVSIVQSKWKELEEAYRGFDPALVARNSGEVRSRAMEVIANERKVNAAIRGAKVLEDIGWDEFRKQVKQDLNALRKLPFMGKVLKYQLARNMGFDVIKPDVHLRRMAAFYGLDPFEMCDKISKKTSLPLHVVDTIIWRASEQGKLNLGMKAINLTCDSVEVMVYGSEER